MSTAIDGPRASEAVAGQAAHGSALVPDGPPVDVAAERPKQRRGFAAMDRRLVSEIARKGGKAAHTAGTAHEFTSDEAREAGRKGGRATHARRRAALPAGAPAPAAAEGAASSGVSE